MAVNNSHNVRLVTGSYDDHPKVAKDFDLFASTIVLWSFQGAPNRPPQVIEWAWDYENLKDEAAFKKRLEADIDTYVEGMP